MQKQIISGTDKLKISELIFVIAAAVVTITAVSTCSPLFPFNPWDDANCFFTVGRGITKGLVPYRDLYEQKGPLLYFIYALAALVSQKSFTGAWIIECIAASVFAVFSWKTVKLFTRPSRFTIALVPVLLGITYTLKLFNFGGNAEELCFPLLSVAFYFVPMDPTYIWVMVALVILTSIGVGLYSPLLWSMYADVADYATEKNGTSSTGLIFSSGTMAQKFGTAISGSLVALLLGLVGFYSGTNEAGETVVNIAPEDMEGVRSMTWALFSIIPAFIALIMLWLIHKYPIKK